jgi:hypothetical protein
MTLVFLALLPTGRAGVFLDVQWLPPDQAVISWPSDPQTYSLQYSTTLSEGGLWQTAIGNPVMSQNRYFVTNKVATAPHFYRLRLNQVGVPFNPNDPAASGYQLVFHDEFDSASTIDLNASGLPGFNWYPQQFFGRPPHLLQVHQSGQRRTDPLRNGRNLFLYARLCGPIRERSRLCGACLGGRRFHPKPILF